MCKRDQSHTDRCRNLLFVACADGVLVELGGLDVVPYAGVVCGFCVRDSCDCNHRGILVAQIRVCRFSYEEDAEDEQ